MRLSLRGKRRSGGKDLERQPLSVSIPGRQRYENILFSSNAGLPYLKDPRSKALEPNCLFPCLYDSETISLGRGRRRGVLNFDDLAFDLLAEVQNAEGGFMNERSSWGAGVEEENVFYQMIRRCVSVAINDEIDFVEFSTDA